LKTRTGLWLLKTWSTRTDIQKVARAARGVADELGCQPYHGVPLENGFELLLVNSAHFKQVPGRKTDVADCAWLAQLLEHGLLRSSFVPPAPIRELRDLTRYRKSLTEERTRAANRLHKVLQDAGIKLSSVATDSLGVSGRSMLMALVAGTTDPALLADLASGQLRKKLPQLRQALTGRFGPHHRFMVSRLLADIDYVEEASAELSRRIEELLAPFAAAVKRLTTIPSVQRRTACRELGIDYFDRHRAERLARRSLAQLQRFGYQVTLTPLQTAA